MGTTHTTHMSTTATTQKTASSQEPRGTRQQQRRQRAANQVSAKSNRSEMACKGKTSRKATQQEQDFIAPQAAAPETRSRTGRKEKLARQLVRLQTRNASAIKLSAKADELSKVTWREARQADNGRRNGFKMTASRCAKRASLFTASL